MAIIGSVDLGGNGLLVLEVDSDPAVTPVDAPMGSMIIYNGIWYRKTDNGASVNSAANSDAANPPAAGPHALGGATHTADTLANLNLKISDANLDDSGASRPPTAHGHTHASTTGQGPNDHHAQSHTIASHSDTTATGAQLNGLVTNVVVNTNAFNYGFVLGDYNTQGVGPTGATNATFFVPGNFASLVSLSAIIIPSAGAAGAGKDIDLFSDYASVGEASNTHDESDTTSTFDLTGLSGVMSLMDISSVFTSLSAGDICGLLIDHNAVGGPIRYLGIRMVYNA